MKTIKSVINQHAALLYFALTFIITWGSIFLIVGSVRFPFTSEQIQSAGPLVYVGMLVGPSAAGLIVIGLVEGRAGYRSLLSRLGKWRVNIRWYAIALLIVPFLVVAILYFLSLASPEYLPAIFTADNKVSLLVTGTIMGLAVGFFEELGWTGFVLPRLRQRYSLLTSGLIMGLLWGAWHYPPFSPSGSDGGSLPPVVYLSILLFSFLPAYRVLMVWMYEQTRSLLVVVLMHAPLSACQLILIPPTLSGTKLAVYDLIFAAVLWIIAAAILIKKRRTTFLPQASIG